MSDQTIATIVTGIVSIVASITAVAIAWINLRGKIAENMKATNETKAVAVRTQSDVQETKSVAVIAAKEARSANAKVGTTVDAMQQQIDQQKERISAIIKSDSKKDLK